MLPGQTPKDRLKRWTKQVVRLVGQLSAPCSSPRILTYHSVGHRTHEMNVHPEQFQEQMEWLAEHVPIIPLRDAIEGTPGIAITFDDGYADNLTQAAPILRQLHFPATVFMVAGCAGGFLDCGSKEESDRLMNWSQVHEIRAMGWEIGAHTLSHRRLSHLPVSEQKSEIAQSKQMLEDQLGGPVPAFAYPFGAASDYNLDSIRLVQDAGFAYAVSNRFGPVEAGADRWTVRRIWVDRTDDLNLFQAKVRGHLDLLSALESPLGLALRRRLNKITQSAPLWGHGKKNRLP